MTTEAAGRRDVEPIALGGLARLDRAVLVGLAVTVGAALVYWLSNRLYDADSRRLLLSG